MKMGIYIISKVLKDLKFRMFKFIMELIIPEGAGTTLFEAKCLDSEDNVSSPPNIANTCFIRRYIKPRKIAWSVQLFVK